MTSPFQTPIMSSRMAAMIAPIVGKSSRPPPLPASTVDYWIGDKGASPAAAVGQYQGLTLVGSNNPSIVTYPGLNGRMAYRSTNSGNKGWYASFASVLPSGAFPYIYAIAGWRSTPSNQQFLCGIGQQFAADRLSVKCTAAAVRQGSYGRTVFGGMSVNNGVVDTAIRRFQAWAEPGLCCFQADGPIARADIQGQAIGLSNAISIGCATGAPASDCADADTFFFLLCATKPTADELAALNAWSVEYYALAMYPLTPPEVLSTNLVLEYDPARGISTTSGRVTNLVDQISTHSIVPPAAGNQPAYTDLDADFLSYQSFASDVSGTDGLRSSGAHGSDLVAAGGRPYVGWLGNIGTGAGSPTEFIFGLFSSGAANEFALYRDSGQSYNLRGLVNGIGSSFSQPITNGVHLLEVGYSGNDLQLYVDNVLAATWPSAGAVTNALRRVSVGMRVDDARWGNAEHGYLIACATTPSPASRAALMPHWRLRGAPV